jgi:acetylornithine deacetylase/succinyl-diaminopimelate desuccinylase-like protein
MVLSEGDAVKMLGGEESYRFYRQLVDLDTRNLEDAKTGKVEKHNYQQCCDLIAKEARSHGFRAKVWDPVKDPDDVFPHHKGWNRPNAIVDYDVGAEDTILVVAHYDTVPVPEAQLKSWKHPPLKFTFADGRIYGRGCCDDKGSGVWTSLEAMKRLKAKGVKKVNVRLFATCDEETGGSGGLGAIIAKDKLLQQRGETPMLHGDVALLPDASPDVLAGSSGVVFADILAEAPTRMAPFLDLAEGVRAFHAQVAQRKSALDSGDWPDGKAPDPKITGRLTMTKLDWQRPDQGGDLVLTRVHAETDSYNTISEYVTVEYAASDQGRAQLDAALASLPQDLGKRVHMGEVTQERGRWKGTLRVQGQGGHGGYPHRFDNPVPYALQVLKALARYGEQQGAGSLGLDMRLPPEANPQEGFEALKAHVTKVQAQTVPGARFVLPDHGVRSGYFLRPDDPGVRILKSAFEGVTGKPARVIGEYGGTDASFFNELRTPKGQPMRALLFGAMDHESNIHSWNENAKPELIAQTVDVLQWMCEHWKGL